MANLLSYFASTSPGNYKLQVIGKVMLSEYWPSIINDLTAKLPEIVLTVWAILALLLVNHGGRNNGIFRIVVQSGFRLIVLGATTAGILLAYADPKRVMFTQAAVNFVLILSGAIGANYISHANMTLRDNPNRSTGPEQLPWVKTEDQTPSPSSQSKNKRTRRRN